MADKEPTNKEIIQKLQDLGVENINPSATKAQLLEMLAKAAPAAPKDEVVELTPKSDMEKILEAVMGLGKSVDDIQRRVGKIEDGGKNDFMLSVKKDDIETAAASKKNADPRVVQIVEETLGVDFGVDVTPNPNSPGFNFTILVPKRLSPIVSSTRPVVDKENGTYVKDKNGNIVEETYWPGDRRSRAVGSTDSFDLIRDHCNKVRAHIVTYYEKLKKPLPEFKLKG